MGIRVIGNEGNTPIRIQRSEERVSVGKQQFARAEQSTVVSEPEPNSTVDEHFADVVGQATSVDPSTYSGSGSDSNGDDTPRKRRGRKPGSTNRRASSGDSPVTSKTTDSLANLVCMLHGVVSNIVKVPALKITADQSRELTAAAIEVSQLYDVPLPTEKVAAWMNLGSIAYKVYFLDGKSVTKLRVVPKQEEAGPSLAFN